MSYGYWVSIEFKIATWMGKLVMTRITKWVLEKIYSKNQLGKDVSVIHMKDSVVEMIMQSNVNLPMCKFSVTIINNSPFDIWLEKIPIDIWLNQPLCRETINESFEIKSRSEKNINVTIFLNELQVKAVKKLKNEHPMICGTAYFQTSLGHLEILFKQTNVAMNNNLSE